MWKWLVTDWQWPAAALFTGLVLLAILPAFAFSAGLATALIFVQLPIYMIHQFEEHTHDRFRQFINARIGQGRELLTPTSVFWINSLGVWGVDLFALQLTWLVEPSFGLIAGYLTVVNGIIHVVQGVAYRQYNPGLITSVLLFLPLGGWCLWESGAGGGFWPHAFGLLGAIAVHALIIAHVVRRLKHLPAASPTVPQ